MFISILQPYLPQFSPPVRHASLTPGTHLHCMPAGATRRVTDLDSVVVGDDVCYVEGDVGRGLQHLHLHLHVAQDAKVTVDERLKLHQVMEWPEGPRETHVYFFLGGRNCG